MKNHLSTLVAEAVDYTKFHFREEEKLMQSVGYGDLEAQKNMHRDIAAKIENFQKKVEDGEPVLSVTLTNEFKSWFRNHILVEDKKYVGLVRQAHK